MLFYHGTTQEALPKIMGLGLKAGCPSKNSIPLGAIAGCKGVYLALTPSLAFLFAQRACRESGEGSTGVIVTISIPEGDPLLFLDPNWSGAGASPSRVYMGSIPPERILKVDVLAR